MTQKDQIYQSEQKGLFTFYKQQEQRTQINNSKIIQKNNLTTPIKEEDPFPKKKKKKHTKSTTKVTSHITKTNSPTKHRVNIVKKQQQSSKKLLKPLKRKSQIKNIVKQQQVVLNDQINTQSKSPQIRRIMSTKYINPEIVINMNMKTIINNINNSQHSYDKMENLGEIDKMQDYESKKESQRVQYQSNHNMIKNNDKSRGNSEYSKGPGSSIIQDCQSAGEKFLASILRKNFNSNNMNSKNSTQNGDSMKLSAKNKIACISKRQSSPPLHIKTEQDLKYNPQNDIEQMKSTKIQPVNVIEQFRKFSVNQKARNAEPFQKCKTEDNQLNGRYNNSKIGQNLDVIRNFVQNQTMANYNYLESPSENNKQDNPSKGRGILNNSVVLDPQYKKNKNGNIFFYNKQSRSYKSKFKKVKDSNSSEEQMHFLKSRMPENQIINVGIAKQILKLPTLPLRNKEKTVQPLLKVSSKPVQKQQQRQDSQMSKKQSSDCQTNVRKILKCYTQQQQMYAQYARQNLTEQLKKAKEVYPFHNKKMRKLSTIAKGTSEGRQSETRQIHKSKSSKIIKSFHEKCYKKQQIQLDKRRQLVSMLDMNQNCVFNRKQSEYDWELKKKQIVKKLGIKI